MDYRDGRLSLWRMRFPTIPFFIGFYFLTKYYGGVIMVNNNAGKGDTYRKVDQKKWDAGWESAFGKNKKTKPKPKKKETKK
tara:strand:- start:226 stop:468 length:243 start_codon:yes stop_codon:yes gene_type:complete